MARAHATTAGVLVRVNALGSSPRGRRRLAKGVGGGRALAGRARLLAAGDVGECASAEGKGRVADAPVADGALGLVADDDAPPALALQLGARLERRGAQQRRVTRAVQRSRDAKLVAEMSRAL